MKTLLFIFLFVFVLGDNYVAFYEDQDCTKPISYYKYSDKCMEYSSSQYLKFECRPTIAVLTFSRDSSCITGEVTNTYCKNDYILIFR